MTSRKTTMTNFASLLRPESLNEVVGQDHAVGQIKGMVKRGQFAQTIMLSGSYSSGKTTIARLIAKYANCTDIDKKSFKTCGKCIVCKGYPKSMPDVHEINCGVNTGVDNARSLVNQSRMAPRNNFRIFILDEVQEATKQAQSALLKPLEEPPANCIWILCTTNPEKVIETARSRCLVMKLKDISPKDCYKILVRACKKLNFKISPSVLKYIASGVQGVPRNALATLEGVYNYVKSGNKLSQSILEDMLVGQGGFSEKTAVDWFLAMLKDNEKERLAITSKVDDAAGFLSYIGWLTHQVVLIYSGNKAFVPLEIRKALSSKTAKNIALNVYADLPALINKLTMYTRHNVPAKSVLLELNSVVSSWGD